MCIWFKCVDHLLFALRHDLVHCDYYYKWHELMNVKILLVLWMLLMHLTLLAQTHVTNLQSYPGDSFQ